MMDSADIYFIQEQNKNGNGNVKIGRVESGIGRRLRELQTGNSNRLRVICRIDNVNPKTEQKLHKIFANDRLSGEWFTYSNKMEKTINKYGVRQFNFKLPYIKYQSIILHLFLIGVYLILLTGIFKIGSFIKDKIESKITVYFDEQAVTNSVIPIKPLPKTKEELTYDKIYQSYLLKFSPVIGQIRRLKYNEKFIDGKIMKVTKDKVFMSKDSEIITLQKNRLSEISQYKCFKEVWAKQETDKYLKNKP